MRTILRFVLCLLLAGLTTSSAFAATATLTYDPVGNIASRTTARGTTTYTYDAINRLTAESGPLGNFNYSYDANGSRLSDSGGSYTYSATSNRLTARHGHAVTTDAAGNITSDGLGHTYVYNQAGRMSEARLNGVLLANYYYDYRGLRTRKVTTTAAPQGAQTVIYHYDEAGHLIGETSATGAPIRTYIWRDDTPLAQIEHVPSRKIIYFEVDHLNTPRIARDQAGAVVWMWESDAFGAIQPSQNPSGLGVVTINLRFPGQYYDQETGLHYNWQRYYDPGSGQYMQPDRIGLAGGSFSTYVYASGNPLSNADPSGLCPWCGAAAGGTGVGGFGGLGGFGHGTNSGNGSKGDGDGLTDPPPKPSWHFPSYSLPHSNDASNSACKDTCDADSAARDADCEWRYKIGGRKDKDGVRACLQISRDKWTACYQKCDKDCSK